MNLSPFVLGFLWNLAIAGVIISFIFLVWLVRKRIITKVDKLVALSVGLILAIVFLWFLPEVFTHGNMPAETVWLLTLSGIMFFYTLDLFLHWHHCKDIGEDGHSHHNHDHDNSPLIAVGTFFDNTIHGVILFSAFSIDIAFGVATTLALLMHAIPQNIVNLLMNHKDTKYVYIAAFGGIFGALLVYPFQDILTKYTFHILAVIAGGLLYTAMSDILPSFKEKWKTSEKLVYLCIMILGIGMFYGIKSLEGEHSHEHIEVHHEEHDEDEHDEDEHDEDEHDEEHKTQNHNDE